ncbi:hypothetical protein CMQ_2592 [Grosmannia clavigera kw1407]|uniref:Uncharacterized protein n=1 Tax=Grosmannia clavigera (strain kw1407 / UAMH 11150) TaxID=655863 RepID=F0XG67_GROCL|nr:uncharacterized protein CMQ_2592 [Grosmannia clavigera kw1407]EFX02663.1 hypothetical protein CMQ_2592 [Grosmannia clavigera kw1407]
MDAMHINSKPCALLPGDCTREREGETAATKRPDSRPSTPGTGRVSGSAASALPAQNSSSPHPSSRAPSSSQPVPAAFLPLPCRPKSADILVANTSDSKGDNIASVGLHTSFPPLFSSPGNNTTPETSLIGARGKSIPLGDGSVADRTSALRELNSNYPSPVLRHGYVKSAGAKNTTYSQPVIVRTYSGPSPSPSSSTHYRRPSSGNRLVGQTAGSGLVSLIPAPTSARWVTGGGEGLQDDEVKLPPVEAFTYKGFLADLQAKTSIRADLDRIAEICAKSKYSLSDQYDAHVAPHGSGAAFISGGSQQPPGRPKGRKKSSSSPGGPTLQAVPSDDDENSARGYRRRRGGVGGGRRRSAAYGTLETIMSSSRSSEEDKSKKKSASEIAEEVRGRAAQKAENTAIAITVEKPKSKSPSSSKERIKLRLPTKTASKEDLIGDKATGPPLPSSRRHGKQVQCRPKSTSFAHAMIGSNRQHSSRSDKPKKGATFVESPFPATSPTVALLSDPAVAQTSKNFLEIHLTPNAASSHDRTTEGSVQTQQAASSSTRTDRTDSAVTEHPLSDADSAGFLSGLSSWIPWVAVDETQNGQPANHSHQVAVRPGPSHAEGSLRELLKSVDGKKPNKGKEVERQRERRQDEAGLSSFNDLRL